MLGFACENVVVEPAKVRQVRALYIYGRLPRGKKVSGSVLTRIDCKHLSGVTT
jgi:hypothetical protein